MTHTRSVDAAVIKADGDPIVNEFSLAIATVNGSGSQTANVALLRALFRMGIPVSGKNLFPSNIQGMPTWFIIRLSGQGYTGAQESAQVLVAMNQETFAEDLAQLDSGGACFYPEHFLLSDMRPDVTYYPFPLQGLLKEVEIPKGRKDYVANMAYVGVVAQILGIDIQFLRSALETHFGGRQAPVEMNMAMIQTAVDWAEANLLGSCRFRVRPANATQGKILIDGNTAAALGALYGGVGLAAWYPITPASSLAEAIAEYLPRLRKDPGSGRFTCAVIQAEDEVAAAGMAVGGGWGGVRAMTSTSGPGLSLMAEFAGLAFFAEVPVVIWDVQRIGPSTGLPTRTSQGDILFARFLGHGDTQQVLILPGSVKECFEFGWKAFDIAERLQTPVFVMSDLDLGMNVWMSDAFDYPDTPMDRGKVLTAEDLNRLGEFARYRDIDGDGIAYRTLPGTDHPLAAYFNRGTGHDEYANYSERPEHWEGNLRRIWRKLEQGRQYMPEPVVRGQGQARVGVIGFGSTDPALCEAQDRLAEDGLPVDYLRLRAVPFTSKVEAFVRGHDRIYVVEQNIDGQMRKLLQLEYPDQAAKFVPVCHMTGLSVPAAWVVRQVMEKERIEP
jgi:2-oxoglutarate ferredoxin oxidoreductase subunit alpha